MTPPPHNPEERPIGALLAPDILAMLEESPQLIAAETEELHPADLADVAEAMPLEQIPVFLAALPKDRAASILEYLDEEVRAQVLEAMSPEQAAELVSAMTPDERADVLEELDEEHADEIVEEMPAEARRVTEQLRKYDPDTAGCLMTTEFVSEPATTSVEEALRKVRVIARSARREAMHAIYTTDSEGRLAGVLSLRELLAAPEGGRLADVAWSEVQSVSPFADREEVAVRVVRTHGARRPGVGKLGDPHGLAARDLKRQRRDEVDPEHGLDRRPGRQQRRARIVEGGDRLQRDRTLEGQRPVRRAAEPAEQAAGAERVAEVARQDAHVRPLAADDVELQLGHPPAAEGEQLDRLDVDAARRALHLDAFARQLVEVTALVAHGGVHRGTLLDVADERRQRRFDRGGVERRGVAAGGDLALEVHRVAALAQADTAVVALALLVQVVDEPGRVAHADRQ